MDSDRIKKAILEKIGASSVRLSPRQLEKILSATYGLDKKHAKTFLKALVARGDLEYTYEFGSTYLVPSFNKPVRISDHVVVKPPGHRFKPGRNDVVVQIRPGAAFGGGRHPTTRLSVRAIDHVLKTIKPDWLNTDCSVLDIGTGSGILAMVAVCLGVRTGLGIDIDPCAVAEAAENVDLNQLHDRLIISDRRIETVDAVYSLVTANLRYPSLKKYYAQITRLTQPDGWVVLSGFRYNEMRDLLKLYEGQHFETVWKDEELDWAVAVLKRI